MADQVRVIITAQDKTKQGIDAAKSNLERLGDEVDRVSGDIEGKAQKAFLGLTIAIGGAVKMAGDFEYAMDRVAAMSGATGAQFDQLKETATKLGAETVFSARQAADAMTYLAMSGFSVEQQIAAVPGVLNMAAAGAVDLATSADIAAGILAGFNLQADEMKRVADILTQGFVSTNVELVDLGEAMKFVAPVAASLNLSIEEITTAVGLLGNAGIKGGNAGRALRSALADLIKPSEEAKEMMDQLGVSIADEQGRFRTLADIIGQLQQSTASMTETQRANAMATIVGTEGVSAMLALMAAGPDTIQSMTKALQDSGGTAERIATQQLDNLNGSLEVLKSQAEDAAIALGDAFTPKAQALMEVLGEGAARVAEWTRTNPAMIAGLGSLAVAVTGTTAAFAGMAAGLRSLWAAMGPAGWAIMGIGAVTGLIANMALSAKEAEIAQRKQDESLVKLNADYERLNTILESSTATDAEKKKAQDELKGIIQEIGDMMPELVSQWDAEGKAIELNTRLLKENTKAAQENMQTKLDQDRADALKKMEEAKQKLENTEKLARDTIEFAQNQLKDLGASPEELQKSRDAITAQYADAIAKARQEAARATAQYARELAKIKGPDLSEPYTDADLNAHVSTGGGGGGNGGGGGTGTGGEDAYRSALRYIDHLKNVGRLSGQEEIAMLEEVQRVQASTAEQRMDIEERIYRAKQALSEQGKQDAEKERTAKLQAATQLLDHQLRMNQIGAREEIQRLQEILQTHTLTNQERMTLEERLNEAQTRFANQSAGAIGQQMQAAAEAQETRIRNALDLINHQERMGEMSKQQEIAALEAHLAQEAAYYRQHAEERWSIEERLYALKEQSRQEDLRKEQEALREVREEALELVAGAEKEALKAIKDRQKAEIDGLEAAIDRTEERLRQYDRQIVAEDRLKKIDDAKKRIADLEKSGAREQVIVGMDAQGKPIFETRIVGMAEAQKALEEAITDNKRAEERERLQGQIENLRKQLAAVRETHAEELASHQTFWEDVRTKTAEGFTELEGLQGEKMGSLATALGTQLSGMLTQWQTYASQVKAIMSSLPGDAPSGTPAPAGTEQEPLPAWAAQGAAIAGALMPTLAMPMMPKGLGTAALGNVTMQFDVSLPNVKDANTFAKELPGALRGTQEAIRAFQRGLILGRVQG